MMKICMSMVTGLTVLAFGITAASAMELKKPKSRSAPPPSYVWYDGKEEKTVWLDQELAVEFDPSPSGESAFKKADVKAKELTNRRGAVRLWKLGGGTDTREVMAQLKAVHPTGRYSPVLRDSPSGAGRKWALPGDVIVYLNPSWDNAAVKAWANSRGLEIVQKLNIGPNVYVIKTGPGLESLETANKLYRSGEVISASPNWWQEAVTR